MPSLEWNFDKFGSKFSVLHRTKKSKMERITVLDKERFLNKYNCKTAFERSGLEWDALMKIHDHYLSDMDRLDSIQTDLINHITSGMKFHVSSIQGRVKDAEHLVEKIIRKCGVEYSKKYRSITSENYMEIVRDTIGIRILTLSKEEWECVFDWLLMKFPEEDSRSDVFMAEAPVAYTRYGDRNIYKGKIKAEHSNKGYRSQHYVVKFNGVFCEIQVRTLAEEVYGEFDHRVKYPYRTHNKFLRRYTNFVAQHLDAVDEMVSTCLQMGEDGWEVNDKLFNDDQYIDWKNVDQSSIKESHATSDAERQEDRTGHIQMNEYAVSKLLRRGATHEK